MAGIHCILLFLLVVQMNSFSTGQHLAAVFLSCPLLVWTELLFWVYHLPGLQLFFGTGCGGGWCWAVVLYEFCRVSTSTWSSYWPDLPTDLNATTCEIVQWWRSSTQRSHICQGKDQSSLHIWPSSGWKDWVMLPNGVYKMWVFPKPSLAL